MEIKRDMFIDCHVHLRDFEKQRHKETIKHGLEVARDSGVDAVFDMTNTEPPVMDEETLLRRFKLADDADVPEVFYGSYMGLTAESEQIKKAVEIYGKYFPKVVGFKLFAGHSVGKIGIIRLEDQLTVYGTLAGEGYDGVMTVHAEKESELIMKLWDPRIPISHCLARPEKAEVESVKDQIALAKYTKFRGKLHIAHISSPIAVDLVNDARNKKMNISCGICPHHFIYDLSQMFNERGVLWKMNPPLRNLNEHCMMLEYLRIGKIDWVETDHAPHSLDEKTKDPFMSGIPGLSWWPMFAEYLRYNNFTEKRIEEVTFSAVRDRFGIDIEQSRREIKDRRKDYSFNPYESIEKKIGWEIK